LYTSETTLTFEPVSQNPSIQRESLVILRYDGRVGLHGIIDFITAPPSATLGQEERIVVYGIFGIITLHCGILYMTVGDHIIVVTSRKKVGLLENNPIYKVIEFQLIPIHKKKLLVSEKQASFPVNYRNKMIFVI
jgi:hypothetical protein